VNKFVQQVDINEVINGLRVKFIVSNSSRRGMRQFSTGPPKNKAFLQENVTNCSFVCG
jgi:hypothetical protein